MKPIEIKDTVKIGSWEEVQSLDLSTITKNDSDTEKLNGLILKGYETKFRDAKNFNMEVYEVGCLDKFINDYFIANGLNMPVDIQHRNDLDHLCGRVIYLEVNSTGFYFVVYIPRTYEKYEIIKQRIQEGILQGFSKCGWATDYELKFKPDGTFDYELIKEMQITTVSIVASPANANNFEKIQEIKNGLRFNNTIEPEDIEDKFDAMFKKTNKA